MVLVRVMKEKITILSQKYNNLSNAKKATIWFMICGLIQRGINIITTPIFTRLLSISEYGIYSLFLSWQEILTIIVSLRLCYGVYMKGLVSYKEDRNSFTSSLLWLLIVQTSFWYILYLMFKDSINLLLGQSTILMSCMFVLILTDNVFAFWSSRERVDFKYKSLISITLIVSIVQPLFGIVCICLFSNVKVESRIISMTIINTCFYLPILIKQMRLGDWGIKLKYWKYGLSFNVPLIPYYLSQIVLNQSDRIMIDHYIGEAAVGLYSLAYSLAMLMVVFNSALQNTLAPWNYRQLEENNYERIKKISNTALLLIALLNMLVIIVAPEVVMLFAPKSYFAAIYCTPPVSMSAYFIFVYSLFINVEMYYEKTKISAVATFIAATLNLVLNYLFIPKFGFSAAAYTTLVCYLICTVCHWVFIRKIEKDNNIKSIYDYKRILLISFTFMGMGFLAMFVYNVFIVRYIFVFVTMFVIILKRKIIINFMKKQI